MTLISNLLQGVVVNTSATLYFILPVVIVSWLSKKYLMSPPLVTRIFHFATESFLQFQGTKYSHSLGLLDPPGLDGEAKVEAKLVRPRQGIQ